jgi:ring-1,2-phenylacetyl-CoA epoxidase subunit PaaD
MKTLNPQQILVWLSEVYDPEIPVLSLPDLGVIRRVEVDGKTVMIELTPTFVGCPALDVMQGDIRTTLARHGLTDVQITVSFETPWTSDRISEKGRQSLRAFGISPPGKGNLIPDLAILEYCPCPRCGSIETELRNIFGSTPCRSIHFCLRCREPFEQFKPL